MFPCGKSKTYNIGRIITLQTQTLPTFSFPNHILVTKGNISTYI